MNYYNPIRLAFCIGLLWFSCTPTPTPDAGHFVQVTKSVQLTAKAGSSHRINVQFRIDDGYHIIARQGEEGNFLPPQLTVANTRFIRFGPALLPAARSLEIEGMELALPVYEQTLEIELPVEIDTLAEEGRQTFMAGLSYQVCDNRKCFFPRTLPFPIGIQIQEAS